MSTLTKAINEYCGFTTKQTEFSLSEVARVAREVFGDEVLSECIIHDGEYYTLGRIRLLIDDDDTAEEPILKAWYAPHKSPIALSSLARKDNPYFWLGKALHEATVWRQERFGEYTLGDLNRLQEWGRRYEIVSTIEYESRTYVLVEFTDIDDV